MSKARLVITAVTVEKRPVSEVARAYGVARSCSYHNAWFRGHSDSESYRLQPTLFRGRPEPSLDVDPIMKKIASCELRIKRVREAVIAALI